MNPRPLTHGVRLIAPIVIAFAVAIAPREARAEFRLSAYAGFERLSGGGLSSTTFQGRAEGTLSFIPWLHGGIYAQALVGGGGQAKTGYGAGALLALRPGLPLTPIDPMGWVSIGYQRAPAGEVFDSGFTVEAGGGIVWHVGSSVDLEARVAYVGLLGSTGMHGFSGALGLSYHL